MIALFLAISYVENGRKVDIEDFLDGWLLAKDNTRET
jgi:hypothetical protein